MMFDFDGTLADSSGVFINAWNTYADQYDYEPVVKEDLVLTRNLTIQQRAKHFRFPMHKLPLILPKIYRYFKENVNEVKLFDGIKDMLDALSEKGYEITILSSNSKENIELFLKQEQITTVSQVLTSSKLFGKDTVIKRFLKQRQLSPEQLVYVGDEVRDIIACNKVHVPFMWVSWGLDGYEMIEKEQPKYVVHSPKELLNTLG
ncbi:HAD-IA family hydrolase [Niallia endozanthoxylica]|uniref:HAD-IA family hydrolase n=1 Tax=Niallia endozanthoxylica TaxID=2036016 RepID=UPI001CC4D376|nr:HAD-IA family hydrolase [Niallia endozanthoxylica]